MWSFLGVIAVTIAIASFEIPQLKKNNLKKELLVFCILLPLAFILSIAKILYETLPNPLDGLTIIYKPLSDFIFKILK